MKKYFAIILLLILSNCRPDNTFPTCEQIRDEAVQQALATYDDVISYCQTVGCIDGAASALHQNLEIAYENYHCCITRCQQYALKATNKNNHL